MTAVALQAVVFGLEDHRKLHLSGVIYYRVRSESSALGRRDPTLPTVPKPEFARNFGKNDGRIWIWSALGFRENHRRGRLDLGHQQAGPGREHTDHGMVLGLALLEARVQWKGNRQYRLRGEPA